jgi:hypothetical protein
MGGLTEAQRAAIPAHVAEWIGVGLSTEPADRGLFADAAERAYRFAGLEWHGRVVWVSSPLAAVLAGPTAARLLSGGAVHGAVNDAVRGAVGAAVYDAVGAAVYDAMGAAVYDAVHDAVGGAVGAAVHDAVHGAVGAAVHDAVHGAVNGPVGDAVYGAVHGAVGGAVGAAVYGAVHGAANSWTRYLPASLAPAWPATTAYYRDIYGLSLDGDMWDRARANEDIARSAGWWWPHTDFAVVSDRPSEIHIEQAAPTGWASHRLHHPTGPSIRWRDGWALYHLHGVAVPAAAVLDPPETWTLARILRELENTEARREVIERVGWDRIVGELGEPVSVCPDPANPPHMLRLFDVPEQVFDEPVRLVVMTNASPDRDGSRTRVYGETVPADIGDPVAACAWAWDVDVDVYRSLRRAT